MECKNLKAIREEVWSCNETTERPSQWLGKTSFDFLDSLFLNLFFATLWGSGLSVLLSPYPADKCYEN